jgi:hypothetical protein
MELLTAELRALLPPLYSQENAKDSERNLQVLLPVVQLDLVCYGRVRR